MKAIYSSFIRDRVENMFFGNKRKPRRGKVIQDIQTYHAGENLLWRTKIIVVKRLSSYLNNRASRSRRDWNTWQNHRAIYELIGFGKRCRSSWQNQRKSNQILPTMKQRWRVSRKSTRLSTSHLDLRGTGATWLHIWNIIAKSRTRTLADRDTKIFSTFYLFLCLIYFVLTEEN